MTINVKYKSDEFKKTTFKNLQKIFFSSIFLTHYNKLRRLYVDLNAFKQWDFAVMIYHIRNDFLNDINFSRIAMQFIMFLNKCFNSVEKNYWSTKLKVTDIIWAIKKIKHMIEFIEMSSMIIYIDHSATISIFRQITFITFNMNKLNLKLIKASQYLFNFNLFIRHKIDKFNVVSDVLFKLQVDIALIEKIDVLKSLYEFSIELCEENLIIKTMKFLLKQFVCYHMTLIEMTNKFKERLKTTYSKNPHWNKILNMIKKTSKINDEKNTQNKSNLRFIYRRNFIYYIVDDDKKRLCISKSLEQKIFQLIHN